MDNITEELLKVDLNPPPLKRQYAKNNLLSYLNFKNHNYNNYNELQEVVLDDDLYRSFVIQRNNEEAETEKEN